ncbi:MAG: CaiB/BaiF CoA transferase family protein, partial [Devosia sp.]
MMALEGIRVVDLTHALAGPFCTHHLSLLGADIIKIEPPAGDDFRPRPHGRFGAVNAGKRSIVLDLKSDFGREALARLIETADIVVENFKPGAAAKLGLDWADLHARYPGLISCSISGYGQEGPMRAMPAIEWSVQAVSGLGDSYLGDEDGLDLGIGMLDPFTGYVAFSGILAALIARGRNGRGQRLDVSMLDAALVLASGNVTASLLGGPSSHGRRATMGRYRARDRRIFVAALNPRWLEQFCAIIGVPGLLADSRFSTASARDANADAFVAAIEAQLASRDAIEWEEMLVAAGIPAGATRTMAEIAGSEHMAGRGLVSHVESEEGPMPVVGSGFLAPGV